MPAGPDEATTRKVRIDSALRSARWDPILPYQTGVSYDHAAVKEYPTASGPADYILFYQGQPIAAVEAKRESIAPQNVLGQAERYSRDIQGSPFTFGKHHI